MSEEERQPLVRKHEGWIHPNESSILMSSTEDESCQPPSESQQTLTRALSVENRIQGKDEVVNLILTWENISVFTPAQNDTFKACLRCKKQDLEKSKKQILDSVSGFAAPGTCLAIMGASGAGKTTLLNTLTHRNQGNLIVEGDIRVNGSQLGKHIHCVSGYVQQDDILLGVLTVREHLWFQSQLKVSKEISSEIREKMVRSVMEEMGLMQSADVQIGVPGVFKGISGGERKRLCFASEVLTNPPILFCDEPTSGLDSFMAASVIQTLRKMASRGRTILCTIHQPSSETFTLFDKLLLMATGGRVAYLGPATEALDFFKQCSLPCPLNYNPADHFIQILAKKPGQEDQSLIQIDAICDLYEMSDHASQVGSTLKAMKHQSESHVSGVEGVDISPYKQGWCVQMQALFWRNWVVMIRDKGVLRSKFVQAVFLALFYGVLYFGQGRDVRQSNVTSINGVLFLSLLILSITCTFGVAISFSKERPVLRKEHVDGLYRVYVYVFTKIMVETVIFVAIPFIFSGIIALTLGFPSRNFAPMLLTLVLSTLAATSFGYLVSAFHDNAEVVIALIGLLMSPLYIFGGFFINSLTIPVYLLWIQYISWFTYGFQMLMVNQWSQVTNITCDLPPVKHASAACFENGSQVLDSIGIMEDHFALNAVWIVVLIVGYRLAAMALLAFRIARSAA